MLGGRERRDSGGRGVGEERDRGFGNRKELLCEVKRAAMGG